MATRTCSTQPLPRPAYSGVFDAVLSVAEAALFKPDMKVYALATSRFGVAPGDVYFQSSNRWDIAGGKVFGYRTNWINRPACPMNTPTCRPIAF